MLNHLAAFRDTFLPKLAVLLCFLLFVSNSVARGLAADPPVLLPAAGVPRALQTDDGWQIYITYFPAPGDREAITKEAPVVVLLHGDKQNRLVYEGPRV